MMKTPNEVIEKYKDSIYTQEGELSVRALRGIAREAGIESPSVNRDSCGYVYINCECIDPHGESPVQEVNEAYKFCCWVKKHQE